MKNYKFIFLDVDGVLNHNKTKDKVFGYYVGIDLNEVNNLKSLVEASNAKILLTSTWRLYWHKAKSLKYSQDEFANRLDKKLKSVGLEITDKIAQIDCNRGEGVKKFLERFKQRHKAATISYVILDDEEFDYAKVGIESHLVKTYFKKGGLTPEKVNEAIEILKIID